MLNKNDANIPIIAEQVLLNKFFTAKKKKLTKTIARELLKNGKVELKGCYSEKTGKTYDAIIILNDNGGKYVNFKMEFPAKKGR